MAAKIKDIEEWRRLGWTEKAYEAAAELLAQKVNKKTRAAAFFACNDLLLLRLSQRRVEEALRVGKSMMEILPDMDDKDGSALRAMEYANVRLAEAVKECSVEVTTWQRGRWGEEIAAQYLRRQGFAILTNDWHSGHRDIDLVAKERETVVFVEVKTRRNRLFGEPELAVNFQKRQFLKRAIAHYMKYNDLSCPTRFDIVAVVGRFGSEPDIRHIRDVRLE